MMIVDYELGVDLIIATCKGNYFCFLKKTFSSY